MELVANAAILIDSFLCNYILTVEPTFLVQSCGGANPVLTRS
jgi:hypothetical protein